MAEAEPGSAEPLKQYSDRAGAGRVAKDAHDMEATGEICLPSIFNRAVRNSQCPMTQRQGLVMGQYLVFAGRGFHRSHQAFHAASGNP